MSVSLYLTPRIEGLARRVTGRATSLFQPDCDAQAGALREAIAGRRVLVAGGAGSIGAATIRELLAHEPSALAVLDPSENSLVELVRTIRSSERAYAGELVVEPLDYGAPITARWLEAQPRFDVVLSFAALKHVRSERDIFSLLRMCEVNLVAADRFLATLRRGGHGASTVFFVSTDKAARPVSLMGASKRAMEALLWAHARPGAPASLLDGGEAPPLARVTTTRFANVAFSDGSLPWGFLQRLEKQQPLAGPSDIRRYLLSPAESGQLCLLAALAAPHGHVLLPRLDPARDQVTFLAIAEATLATLGLGPAPYADRAAAIAALPDELRRGRYPVVFLPSDTSGEKESEEFVAAGEQPVEVGLSSAFAVAGSAPPEDALRALLRLVDDACRGGELPSKQALVRALAAVVPDLAHLETGASLDGKM